MNLTFSISNKNPFTSTGSSRLVQKTWYHLGRTGVNLLKPLLFRMDVVYHTPVPSGAKLLCANHPSTVDPVMMTTLVPEHVSILISETLFKVPVLGPSLKASGHIRVVESSGRPALEEGLRCLANGQTVGIFPEGAISPADGKMARSHTGAARMAVASGVPVIPVGIALKSKNILRVKTLVDGRVEVGTWYLSGPYAITVGEPMVFTGDVNDRAYVQAVTCQIAERIAELSRESARRLDARVPRKVLPNPADVPSFQPSLVNLWEIAEPFLEYMRLVFVRSKSGMSFKKG